MKRFFGMAVIEACVVAGALAGAPSVLAETKTYCDDKCNLKYCSYTCCHITTTPIEGVDVITKMSCSSSVCCAHPEASVVGGAFDLPTQVIEGISAPVKLGLAGTAGLDASAIAAESNEKTRTVTLSGTVQSAAQRSLAGATAERQAKGYKVVNRLTIAKCP
jgi:hypothetical protein